MAFSISRSFQREHDDGGGVRSLSQAEGPYGRLANILNVETLTEVNLRDVAAEAASSERRYVRAGLNAALPMKWKGPFIHS